MKHWAHGQQKIAGKRVADVLVSAGLEAPVATPNGKRRRNEVFFPSQQVASAARALGEFADQHGQG